MRNIFDNDDFEFTNEELGDAHEDEFDEESWDIDDEFPDLPEEVKKPIRLLVRNLIKDLMTGIADIYLESQNRQDR